LRDDPKTPAQLLSDGGLGPPPVSPESNCLRFAVLAARWFIAAIFIYASAYKIPHPAAFAKDIYNYQILPDALINLTALVLPWLELLLGLCLLTGIWLPGAVITANGLLVLFLASFVFNLSRGLDVNCGCFGSGSDTPAMSAGWYLARDTLFLAVGIFLFYTVFLQRRLTSRTSIEAGKEFS
jgi:uncharacterized membrane protein YphA (DoxX/SURF4 family)